MNAATIVPSLHLPTSRCVSYWSASRYFLIRRGSLMLGAILLNNLLTYINLFKKHWSMTRTFFKKSQTHERNCEVEFLRKCNYVPSTVQRHSEPNGPLSNIFYYLFKSRWMAINHCLHLQYLLVCFLVQCNLGKYTTERRRAGEVWRHRSTGSLK